MVNDEEEKFVSPEIIMYLLSHPMLSLIMGNPFGAFDGRPVHILQLVRSRADFPSDFRLPGRRSWKIPSELGIIRSMNFFTGGTFLLGIFHLFEHPPVFDRDLVPILSIIPIHDTVAIEMLRVY
jgi:hypothetical protein